jgi:hypothetical protein
LSDNALTDEFIAAVKLLIAEPPSLRCAASTPNDRRPRFERAAQAGRTPLIRVSLSDIDRRAVKSEIFVPNSSH